MATRSRDTAPPGKEKRGTSPSPIHNQRSTTNTSKTTSPVRKQADPTTTLNNNIPSYLKPTIAQSKKSASSSDLHNIHNNNNKSSLLTRRRSFDNKPPLPSSSPKTRISPNPRERIPRSSSSLSSKTSTSQKPLLDKFSKTSKDAIGKQRSAGLNSRPVTKKKTIMTTTTIRKHDSTNGSNTKASIITNSQGEQSEPEEVHEEVTIHESAKEMIMSDSEMASNSDAGDNDSAMDDHEENNGNINNAELEDIKAAAESSTLVEEEQEFIYEEAEDKKVQVEEQEKIRNEPNKHDSTEKEKEEMVINTSSEENQELKEEDEGKETPMVEETEAVQEEELCQNPKQVEVDIEETEAVPEKKTTVASSKSQLQVVQGKNKESVVSNNVIEETASKLREQRKNKVRALAGAFETVISLQEPK
ncbi:uncharacterized protein [Nicotiana sylvestris]|uniref:Tropomyosin-like n=2 Tax=Nicotiana TaxID=4085 RepID=A0A1S4CXS1_TOBAC|nr:PREDICTED: tropomyosin [Nicotiana sylvestris]XP_016505938.1 PREDICTED: tropomyosin-like [Nicotiana tabacum]